MTANGLRFDRCPKAWLREEVPEVLTLIADRGRLHRHGILPEAGGWNDQGARWAAAMAIVEEEILRAETAAAKPPAAQAPRKGVR